MIAADTLTDAKIIIAKNWHVAKEWIIKVWQMVNEIG